MKWLSEESALKQWIDKHRERSYAGDEQVVLAIIPKKIGYGDGAPVYWLEPVRRVRESSSWEPSWCLDPGYSAWWHYRESHAVENLWDEWRKTRPMHHLAGLVDLLVYWSPLWISCGFFIGFTIYTLLGG